MIFISYSIEIKERQIKTILLNFFKKICEGIKDLYLCSPVKREAQE
jgi:hypothetical protein